MPIPGLAMRNYPILHWICIWSCHHRSQKQWIPGNINDVMPNYPTFNNVNDAKLAYPRPFDAMDSFAGTEDLEVKQEATVSIDVPRKTPIQIRDSRRGELDEMDYMIWEWSDRKCGTQNGAPAGRIVLEEVAVCESVFTPRNWRSVWSVPPITYQLWRSSTNLQMPMCSASSTQRPDNGVFTCPKCPSSSPYFKQVRLIALEMLTSWPARWPRRFEARMDQILEGLLGVTSTADDVCMYCANERKRDENLYWLRSFRDQRNRISL